MLKNKFVLLAFAALLAFGAFQFQKGMNTNTDADEHESEKQSHSDEGHGHADEEHSEEEHGKSDSTEIHDAAANNAGIEVLQAGPASIHESLLLTGRITLNENTTTLVKARFPGIVRAVYKGLGETVKVGDALAKVESNDSLQTYSVKAPSSGIIIERHTSVGDVADDEHMFVIADLSDVWAEFHIFPRDLTKVKRDQKLYIKSVDGGFQVEATIASLLPVAEASSQTVIARVTIPNPDEHWRSGMTVRGEVILNEKQAPVAVSTAAVQRSEGSNVVFVKEGETYTARKVELGMADDEWTEIRSGISAGESYVAKNSFTVKADIGKAGAEHEH